MPSRRMYEAIAFTRISRAVQTARPGRNAGYHDSSRWLLHDRDISRGGNLPVNGSIYEALHIERLLWKACRLIFDSWLADPGQAPYYRTGALLDDLKALLNKQGVRYKAPLQFILLEKIGGMSSQDGALWSHSSGRPRYTSFSNRPGARLHR